MTAINIIRHRDAVHVLSDGEMASVVDGTSIDVHTSKVWPLPHLNAVIAGRGPALGIMLLSQEIIARGKTYDEVKAAAGAAVKIGDMMFAGWWTASTGEEFPVEIMVAGISESTGPDAYAVAAHDQNGHFKPFTATDLPDVSLSPLDAEGAAAFQAMFPAWQSGDDLDPVRDGLRIMEMQRERYSTPGAGQPGVAGFAQLTTVRRSGIESRILRRWPNKEKLK